VDLTHGTKATPILMPTTETVDPSGMDSIFSIGLSGMQRGLESAERNSERVASAFLQEPTQDLVEPLVALQLDKRQVEASARVVKIGDEMLGTVLDIIA
jgi:hypothetical protein